MRVQVWTPPVRLRVPAGAVLDGEGSLDGLGDGAHEARVSTSAGAHGLRFMLRWVS